MNRSNLYIIAGGFFFALLAAVLVQLMLGGKKPAPEAAAAQHAEVLVAARDLEVGHTLQADDMAWLRWPADAVYAGAVVRADRQAPADALQGRLMRSVAKGEPMLKSALVDDTKSNFVAASLTPGKRAVAITVEAGTSVGGFVTPGDMVDVILTYDVRFPDNDRVRESAGAIVTRSASETIAESLKVLAVDQNAQKSAEAKIGRTVTLEVDPRQAETLALADNMGDLSLVLRGIGDKSTVSSLNKGKSVEPTTDLRTSHVMRELMGRQQNNSGQSGRIVRIYNGASAQTVEVRAR